jgi:hypothetical protein
MPRSLADQISGLFLYPDHSQSLPETSANFGLKDVQMAFITMQLVFASVEWYFHFRLPTLR